VRTAEYLARFPLCGGSCAEHGFPHPMATHSELILMLLVATAALGRGESRAAHAWVLKARKHHASRQKQRLGSLRQLARMPQCERCAQSASHPEATHRDLGVCLGVVQAALEAGEEMRAREWLVPARQLADRSGYVTPLCPQERAVHRPDGRMLWIIQGGESW
jgi:hypothetical protein